MSGSSSELYGVFLTGRPDEGQMAHHCRQGYRAQWDSHLQTFSRRRQCYRFQSHLGPLHHLHINKGTRYFPYLRHILHLLYHTILQPNLGMLADLGMIYILYIHPIYLSKTSLLIFQQKKNIFRSKALQVNNDLHFSKPQNILQHHALYHIVR